MGLILYNLVLILSLPLILPVFVFLAIFRPDERAGWSERIGAASPGPKPDAAKTRIWIHAASVGECLAVLPLIELWLRERPEWDLIVSVMTQTGRRLAEQRLGGRVRVFFFPIDLPGIPARLLRRLTPDLILLVETELWPNFLRSAHRADIPVVLLNGRISPRSYRRYRAVRWLLRESLREIRVFCMQTAPDAARIMALGAPPERVRISGNLKFDQAALPLSEAERRALLRRLGWSPDDPILVAGSTHEKEEDILLAGTERIREQVPSLRLVLAPRHLNRLPGLIHRLKQQGKSFGRYSELDSDRPEKEVSILLVDTLGKLRELYSLGTVVFVGGSLVPVGGHNLLEPAALGRPVLFGPFIEHVSETADLLSASGGGRRVCDGEDLTRQILSLLTRTDERQAMAQRALETVRRHRGVVRTMSRVVERQLKDRSFGRPYDLDFRAASERWFRDRLLLSRGGILTSLAAAALRGLSILYRGWQEFRAAAYARGLLRSVRLPRPVISVGNLTLGGTGKTPAVIAVCRFLLKAGHRPAVLSRGYGGRSKEAVQAVSDPTGTPRGPEAVGDEPRLMADRLPEVPVFVSSNRAAAGRCALQTVQPTVFVLDDGYQHLRLRRDLNLLVMDAVCPFGNGFLFPRGILRESLRQIKRADAVLLTHVGDPAETEALQTFIRSRCPGLPVFTSRHKITRLTHLGGDQILSLEQFKRDRWMAVAGIGQPDRFFQMLREMKMAPAAACVYPDHYPYRAADLTQLEEQARRFEARKIVTTEKDAVRIKAIGRPLESWWAAGLELEMDQPEAFEALLGGAFR